MWSILLVALALGLPVAAASQEKGEGTNPIYPELNSITHLLLEHPPQLQPGFGSEADRWLLYSPQFDVLSAGLQTFILKKYGYLSPPAAGLIADRTTFSVLRGATPALLAPGLNVKVTNSDAETGRRVQSEACIAVSGQSVVVGYNDSGGNEREIGRAHV